MAGNYLHSYFESKEFHEEFLENHPEILAKTGKNKCKLKSNYLIADKEIECLETDPAFNELYQGDKEVIVTGKLFGVKWKGKIDCLNLERGYFIDLKTTAKLDKKYWNKQEHKWESFVAAYNYQLQMWVYQQLIKQTFGVVCQPYIVLCRKRKFLIKAIVSIPEYRIEEAEREIEMLQNHIELVKTGK